MTTLPSKRFASGLLASGVLLAACAASAPVLTVEPADQAPALSPGRLRFGDTDLMRSIQVLGYSESESANGLLQAVVKLRSRLGRIERFEWRVVWIDSAGFQVPDDVQPWKPLQVEPLGECDLQATASHPKARTFRLELRREKPIAGD
jgi:uncharacterized protein YcfL